eukprot:5990536-Alexandrium_andersonii.AAC.1
MSASLVGSEMCIRDRSETYTLDGLPIEVTWNWLLLEYIGTLVFDEAHPVSYTHLTLPTICSV